MPYHKRVFITHSSLDKELAEILVKYIRLSAELPAAQVFCTSIDGHGIPTGAAFMDFIRRQLRNTTLVVPLVTPAYLDSVFCQWELGAVWARSGLSIFPIRVDQIAYNSLPAPLAQLQVARLDPRGLGELATRVTEVFHAATPALAVIRAAEAEFLESLPTALSVVQPRWESTEMAQLRRSSKYAAATSHLHMVFHTQRDASFLLVAEKQLTPQLANLFVEKIREMTKHLAKYFTQVTGTDCRITLKQFLAVDNEFYVQDIARNHGRLQTNRDLIADNTDFEIILRAERNFYRSNDLTAEIAKGYKNSHGVPGKDLSYLSTIVWPVRKRLASKDVAAQIGAPLADHDLLGFLCVDAAKTNAFSDADFEAGAAVADSLYPVLLPYLAPERGAPH